MDDDEGPDLFAAEVFDGFDDGVFGFVILSEDAFDEEGSFTDHVKTASDFGGKENHDGEQHGRDNFFEDGF